MGCSDQTRRGISFSPPLTSVCHISHLHRTPRAPLQVCTRATSHKQGPAEYSDDDSSRPLPQFFLHFARFPPKTAVFIIKVLRSRHRIERLWVSMPGNTSKARGASVKGHRRGASSLTRLRNLVPSYDNCEL